ncbi:MAG: CotH kinase family protein [Chitinophagales bacterium]
MLIFLQANKSTDWLEFKITETLESHTADEEGRMADSTHANGLYKNVFINEIVPANGPQMDEFGETEDWVEIYNGSDDSILLKGLYLTDDPSDLKKWQVSIPISIPSGGFSIIWADKDTEQGGNHADFKLKGSGEYLVISQELNGDLQVLDEVQFPKTPFKASYGRETDGSDNWVFFGEVSPNESNNEKHQFLDSPVIFSKPGGIYSTLTLEMTTSNRGAKIFYTTDGSIPTPNDLEYSAPISVNSTKIICAKAFKNGFWSPQTTIETYILNSNSSLPIISVQTEPENLWSDKKGIYVLGAKSDARRPDNYWKYSENNFLQDWERSGNIAFYEANGTKGFQVNVGIKIGGGRKKKKKAKGLNFFLRNGTYGDEKIDYQVFPGLDIDKFRRIKIRASGNDWQQMLFRDGVNQTLLYNTVDFDLMAYRPVRVYLNGEYWGIYGLREFFNHDYVESHHGVDADNLDFIVNPSGRWADVRDGDYDAMQSLLDYVASNDMKISKNYETVHNWMDINQYLNYQIVQIYLANYDWPDNNVRVWRNRDGGKFRWMLYDTDQTTNYVLATPWQNTLLYSMNDDPYVIWPAPVKSTLLFRNLVPNPDFKAEFIQRTMTFRDLLFHPDRVNPITDSLQAMLEPEMQQHLDKWNPDYPKFGYGVPSGGSISKWKDFIGQYKSFFKDRRHYIIEHYRTVLDLGDLFQLTLNFDEKTNGKVVLHQNQTDVPFKFTATYFVDIPIKIKAVAKPGFRFLYWKETGETKPEIEFKGTEDKVLTPVFAPTY